MAGPAGPGAALEGLRRALARLGSEVVVRDEVRPGLAPPVARAVRPPRPAVRAPAHIDPPVAARALPAPAVAVRAVAPVADAVRLRAAGGAAAPARVRRVHVVDAAAPARRGHARLAGPPARAGAGGVHLHARVRGVAAGAPAPASHRRAGEGRRMRRRPVPWDALGRPRLAAAWAALTEGHGVPGDQLELIGVYGPVPAEGVVAASVGRVGRVARIALAPSPAGAGSPAGADLALARHVPTGDLLSAVIPRATPSA